MANDERLPREAPAGRRSHLDFPVVGIGASAGGFRALNALLEQLPADAGLAIVVILHLSPKHESNAAQILQRVTKTPVVPVMSTTPIERNHIYVISPNSQLEMIDGTLRVVEAGPAAGRHVAIDLFFRTLAQAHREHAIAVVLSGSGADGSMGIASVKEMGGVTIAQLPDDAEYEDMPRNAIASGHVDFVLSAGDIPDCLVSLRRTAAAIRLPPDASDEAPDAARTARGSDAEERALADILRLLEERTGHDFRNYKRATLLRRIERRLQINAQTDVLSYRDYLEAHEEEAPALLRDLLISVTNFFRDRQAFEALEREVVPALFSNRAPDEAVRAWVAGCATGEEAYSVAMLLCEAAQESYLPVPGPVQVFATDIDERALGVARAGTYPPTIVADVPPKRLRQFFEPDGERLRIRKSVRDNILFAQHNVLRDPPFSQVDLVCCRNLLIYLERGVQSRLLETFHFALRPGGYLFLGTSEAADMASQYFDVVDKKHRIFRARPRSRAHRPLPILSVRAPSVPGMPDSVRARARGFSFAELHQRVLEQYAPPSVVVDSDGCIVHVSARAGRFLHFAAGEPSRTLVDTVRPELRLELRTALFQAMNSGKSVEARRVRLEHDGQTSHVTMVARPFHDAEADQRFVLVLFDEVEDTMGVDLAVAGSEGKDSVLLQLEEELRHTRERLQLTMEQSDASSEELKASNEELQAINEELRSATEELETSKEELQSLNEELTTVNYELKLKVDETGKANDDLQNFIASTDIATVFVDAALRIKRFTPRASAIFNTIPGDVGRSLLDITHRLDYAELGADTTTVFDTLQPVEREVRSIDGRLYISRIVPYRTGEHHIDGAVLTFVDITRLRDAETKVARYDEDERQAPRRALSAAAQLARSQSANAAKDEFLAVVSHELKQPLNLIGVNAAVLARLPELRDSPAARRAVEGIQRSVQGQSRIIEDLLDLTRIRTGKLELAPAAFDLETLAQRVVEMAKTDAASAKVSIALDTPGHHLLVWADPLRIEQVIWNLIGNGVKFTPDGGHVRVRVGEEGGEVFVEVADDGQGIAPEILPHIFEMFQQGGELSARNRAGLGIGLSLVRQIIELHGGHVQARSDGVGTGTSIRFWLPEFHALPAEHIGDAQDQLKLSMAGVHLLVVDDDRATVESLGMLLELAGATVLQADDARVALQLAREHAKDLDLILTDIGMPDMDGYEMLAELRANPDTQHLPVVALTGFGRLESGHNAADAGFAAKLTKPVNLPLLVEAIQGAMAGQGSAADPASAPAAR